MEDNYFKSPKIKIFGLLEVKVKVYSNTAATNGGHR